MEQEHELEIQVNSLFNEDSHPNKFIVNMAKAIILTDIYEISVRMDWKAILNFDNIFFGSNWFSRRRFCNGRDLHRTRRTRIAILAFL